MAAGAKGTARIAARQAANPASALTRDEKISLYRWMRLTRALEERLASMHRQGKLVGGLYRSLGQEAEAVASAFALETRDVLSSLTRNLGSLLVKGATPVEVVRQHTGAGDSPTRGRDLGLHFADLERGFIGHVSPLGDMLSVMAGVTLSFRVRGENRVGLVYAGEGASSTGAFHEGLNFAAVQHCPLVVILENNGYAYSTPTSRQTAARHLVDKAPGYGVPGERVDGNDVFAVYAATKRAVDRARSGGGVTLVEVVTYRRCGHAQHDNQSYVPEGEVDRWAAESDPIDRYVRVLLDREKVDSAELEAVDAHVQVVIDEAVALAERSAAPAADEALQGVFADPPAQARHWYR